MVDRVGSLRERYASNLRYGDVTWLVLLSPLTLFSSGLVGASVMAQGPAESIFWGLFFALGFTLPLYWRRSLPEEAALALVGVHVVQVLITDTPMPGNVTAPMALYAAVRYGKREHAQGWLAIGVVGAVLGGLRWGLSGALSGSSVGTRIAIILGWMVPTLAIMVAVWFSAQWARQREDNIASLQDRADALERERDKAITLAAVEERSRIAREMHDIVAHSLSVIVVQSDGAGYLAGHGELGDAEARLAQVTRAIETINQTARQALGETRRLVGVLRQEGDALELAPAATLDQIAELVTNLRAAGVPANFSRLGDPGSHPSLTPGAEMALYRVAQESLTNVMKHAGPGASVDVTITHDSSGVGLRVIDTGRGTTESDGAGHGVIGMRERIAAYGGQLTAGPRPGGGFQVLARLSVEPQDPPRL